MANHLRSFRAGAAALTISAVAAAGLITTAPFAGAQDSVDAVTVFPVQNFTYQADAVSIGSRVEVTGELAVVGTGTVGVKDTLIVPNAFDTGVYEIVGEVYKLKNNQPSGDPVATATAKYRYSGNAWWDENTTEVGAPAVDFGDVTVEADTRYVVYETVYKIDSFDAEHGADDAAYTTHHDQADARQSFYVNSKIPAVTTVATSTTFTTTTSVASATTIATEETTTTEVATSTSPTTTTELTTTVVPVTTNETTVEETTEVVTSTNVVVSTVTESGVPSTVTSTEVVSSTVVVTNTPDPVVLPAVTTDVTETSTAVTTVSVAPKGEGSAALSSKLPWWLLLLPVIPAVIGFVWNAAANLQLPGLPPAPAGSAALFGGAPADQPGSCRNVEYRGHDMKWGVLGGVLAFIIGGNLADQCVDVAQ